MATQTVNSYDLSHVLIEETGRISEDIHRRTIDSSVWLKLVNQEAWPDEMGDTISVLTYERTLPATANTWQNVNSDSNKFAIPDAQTVNVAQTARTFGLQHTAIESDPIVVTDVRMSFRFKEQLKNVYTNLVENVAYLWKTRYRDQYVAAAEHKMVAYLDYNGVLVEDADAMPTQANAVNFNEALISRLTQGILNRIYMSLIRDGAGSVAMGKENGKPIFTLVTSAETSENIVRQTDINTTDALLYNNSRVSELLAPLGVERSIRGFYHVVDPFPKRFTYNAGTWTEVLPYVEDTSSYSGQQGSNNRYIVNTAYEDAEYEESYIFIPEVFTSLVPKPFGQAGSGVSFDPISYRGDYRFLNIPDRVENPDGSWGYFRGVLGNGAKPVSPQWGYAIRHLRADTQFSMLDLNEATVPLSSYDSV